jgi:hypothetical protein
MVEIEEITGCEGGPDGMRYEVPLTPPPLKSCISTPGSPADHNNPRPRFRKISKKKAGGVRWGDESDKEGAQLEQVKLIPRRRRKWKEKLLHGAAMILTAYLWYRMLRLVFEFAFAEQE